VPFFAYSFVSIEPGSAMSVSSCSLFFRLSSTLLTKRGSRPILFPWLASAASSSASEGG